MHSEKMAFMQQSPSPEKPGRNTVKIVPTEEMAFIQSPSPEKPGIKTEKVMPSEEMAFAQSPSPEKGAGWLSILYSWWILPLLRQASRREVELEEIYSVRPKDSTANLGSRLAVAWKKELQFKSPSLHRAIFRTFGLQFFFLTLACTASNCLLIAQSVLLGNLMVFFEGLSSPEYGYTSAVLLILINYTTVTLAQLSQFGCQRMGMNIRVAVSRLLYDKSLRLRQQSLASSGVGQAVNMLSNDVNRYDWALYFLPFIVAVPLQIVILSVVIYECVGPSFLAGVGVLVLLIPIQGLIATVYGKLRASVAKKSDRRLSLLTELINGMQLVKISCWEEPFRVLLSKARQNELLWIRLKWILHAMNGGVYVGSGKLVIFLSILSYVFEGNVLTPEKVFLGFSLYKNTMLTITEMFPTAIGKASEVNVSTKRIQKFLLLKEKSQSKANTGPNQTSKGIDLEAVSASWVERDDQQKTLDNINLCLGIGDLLVINGQVGSGKSSLLQVLMGELEADSGLVSVRGRVAYAAQDAWVYPGNVKENIVFGSEFDQSWYDQVIEACALQHDIESLPNGDLTLVGDRGVTLSGGQRARVSLARAVYSKADIYLLDDPLSAVDAKVAKHLTDNCIRGLLKHKCVLLVTHQLNYFSPDTRVLMLDNGRASKSGSIEELLPTLVMSSHEDTTLDALVRENKTDWMEVNGDQASRKKTDCATFKKPLIDQEFRSVGSVTWRLFAEYLMAGNGYLSIGLLIILLFGSHFLFYGCDYYLIILTDSQTKMAEANSESLIWEAGGKLQTYAWLIGSVVLVSIFKDQIFYHVCWSSSRALFSTAFEAVLRAPMRFFDENSNGRILNRFSSDTGTMDEAVPSSLYYTIYVMLDIISTLIFVFILSPVIIVFVVLFLPFYVYLQKTFLSAVFRVKRLEGIARSPVFAHLSSTIEGLSTIRCFESEQYFTEQFLHSQDVHSSAWFAYVSFSNWCAMTSITLGTGLLAIIIFFFMLGSSPGESSSAGLAIAIALTLTTNFYGGTKFMSDLANQIVAVERVLEYSKTVPEALHQQPGQVLPKDWPVHGDVSINNLVVKYGDAPPVVRGISLSIKHSEKVGIVGRTGAGKSSLIGALFRLVEPAAGQVHIDGLKMSDLGLQDARSAMSFIPQNPVIFSGTIRKNLDPFEIHDDAKLWDALVKVQLADRMLVDGAVSGLDSTVSECGVNFSQGERQLICLARSLLSNKRIVILDEATANIDPRTEHIIQETIRKHFEGSTVIVIAHRLETVIELDQIFLMDAGMILEFGEPIGLLDKQGGRFRELVMRTGQKKAEALRSLATKAHLERACRKDIGAQTQEHQISP